MNHVFTPRGYFTVPDGTEVCSFLNATDVTESDVPWGALGEMSIATGRIGPKVHSWVHIHPAVTQVTYVYSGGLTVRMRDASSPEPYDLELRPGQAVVSEPGTLFQLRNDSDAAAEVLYIVSPSYVFEMEGGEVTR
jgi:mannose-6-phosphate isomerase-like protein (cupin superfamily)